MSKKSNRADITLLPKFNLSQLQKTAYNQSTVSPVQFINSPECKALLLELTGLPEPHTINLGLDVDSNQYFTYSKWLFLAYLRHCFGNDLTQAINHELAA